MADHKFRIGQTVLFRPKLRQTDTLPDYRPYRVVQILSARIGEPQYRIKGSSECMFAARESELRSMQAVDGRGRRYA